MMSEEKLSFMAKYGDVDIDKELSHDNPNPNKYVILRSDATNAHAVKLLHHPNEVAATFVVYGSAVKNGHRMIKKTDLEKYLLKAPKTSDVAFHIKRSLDAANEHPEQIVPFHPETGK